tara:strand:- start:55 stop:297 length:243 start_codon:yes stop_codon:yes gene_type:complete
MVIEAIYLILIAYFLDCQEKGKSLLRKILLLVYIGESFILITYLAESKSISKPFSDVLKNCHREPQLYVSDPTIHSLKII